MSSKSTKLTHARVQKFEAHIKRSYEGVFFELMVTHNLVVRKVIELTWIIVKDRKQGVGTAIMRELCELRIAMRRRSVLKRHPREITPRPPLVPDSFDSIRDLALLQRFVPDPGMV